jgi:hypothetical protein
MPAQREETSAAIPAVFTRMNFSITGKASIRWTRFREAPIDSYYPVIASAMYEQVQVPRENTMQASLSTVPRLTYSTQLLQ